MKKLIFLALSLSVVGIVKSFGQQPPVDLSEFRFNSAGVIYISATDSIASELKYDELNSDKVYLVVNGKSKKYLAKEVVGFRLDNPAKRYISAEAQGLGGRMLFYENLTPSNAKLYLVKYFVADRSLSGTKIAGGKTVGEWQTSVYSPVQKKMLGSNFKKIAESVKDCPVLAQKISKKEKGYYFGLMSLPGVADEVYNRIVTEYNSCN